MGRPWKIFVYYISIVLVFAGLVYFTPGNLQAVLSPEAPVVDIDSFMMAEDDSAFNSVFPEESVIPDTIPDTTAVKDSVAGQEPPLLPVVPYLYFNEKAYNDLSVFFSKAENARKDGKTVRVLHMGDSQIEGDRITRYIRESFQQRYGGTGPGLFTVADPHNINPSVWLINYGEWIVYDIYNRKQKLEGKQYGIIGRAVKFVPGTNSGFRFRASPWAQKKAKSFYKVRLFLGEIKDTLYLKGYEGKTEIINDTLERSKGLTEINWEFSNSIEGMKLMFESKSSPPFLGCALDSMAGIAVDNLALRGQSTPWLLRTNRSLFKTMAGYLDVGLIIFQFGTNMIPTKTYDFDFYRIKIERQLRILKKLVPNCAIIVVGTADAGYLDKGEARSYDHIAALNKAQQEAALNSGAAFFDLYNAMGGEGSIINWVNNVPPLAITDYIHFTKAGGKRVAGMMLKSIYALSDTLSVKDSCNTNKVINKKNNGVEVPNDTVPQQVKE